MKISLRQIVAAGLLAIPAVLGAAGISEQKLADTALAAGDYTNAIGGYHNAMVQADQQNDPDAWADSALKLCRTYLRAGDLSKAREVLAEFRRRHPLRSAGTLPGDLLAAEGRYDEAEKAFTALAAGDPASLPAVNFSRGMMYLRAGKLDEACALFTELALGKSAWAEESRIEAVYILIRSGKNSEAEKFINSVPAEQRNRNWAVELYLVEAYLGQTAQLKQNFDAFIESRPAHPHIRLLELLSVAAETATKNGDFAFAVRCLRSALDFSPEIAVKQKLHRQLINICADHFPEQAVTEARLYVRNHPDAPERGQVMNFVAQKLRDRAKLPARAFEIFAEVALSSSFPVNDRLQAASDAIVSGSKLKKIPDLSELYIYLCHNALQPTERGLWHCRFAGYLEQNNDLSGALREYRTALQATSAAGREDVHFELMNFFLRTKDEKNMVKEAELLCNSKNLRYQADAKFLLGKTMELRGEYTTARTYYLESSRIKAGKNQENAQFLAALMAYRNNFDDDAAKEFVEFAAAHKKSELAPHALYMALEILLDDNSDLKKRAVTLFKEHHSRSDAWAYYVLNQAAEVSRTGDINHAIAELEKLEKDFTGTVVGLEITLQKAVFLNKSGKSDQALTVFSGLISNSQSPVIAAEGALYAGEILFHRGKYQDARAMFLVAARMDPATLLADIADIRAVDCILVQSASLDPEQLAETAANCEKLIAATKYPQIRLQALYKLGLCREWMGSVEAAISTFEKLLYAAREIADSGIAPEAQWCIRGTETALELLVRHRLPGALQRGMQMIKQLDKLGLKQDGMQKKFREQLEKTRRK